MGRKLGFIELETGGQTHSQGGQSQVMLNSGHIATSGGSLQEDAVKEGLKNIQRGDWLGASCTYHSSRSLLTSVLAIRGRPEYNERNEFILKASELPISLAPTLQTVPKELHDPEFKMRNRHAASIVYPSERDMLFLRQMLLMRFRTFMFENKFIEVQTPLLVAGASGAAARPFETVATEFAGRTLNLRIAPELFLKRLVIGGMQRVYELGPAFRNEGVDNTHNPEFIIAEFYGVMLRLNDLITLTEKLFKSMARATKEAAADMETILEPEIDFTSPYPQISFIPGLSNAIRKVLPDWRFPDLDDEESLIYLQRTYRNLDMSLPAEPTIPRLLDGLSAKFLEPRCQTPTFITYHPECMAPLAKSERRSSPTEGPNASHSVSIRAELFIKGREYVNCYEEENSPIDQRRKFEEQLAVHQDAETPKAIDESYLSALEWGMPPTGGWGCGIDRILMLFGGRARIADVLPFGTLRNVVALGSQRASEQHLQQEAEEESAEKPQQQHQSKRRKEPKRPVREGRPRELPNTDMDPSAHMPPRPAKSGTANEASKSQPPLRHKHPHSQVQKEEKDLDNIDWLADAAPSEDVEEDEEDFEDRSGTHSSRATKLGGLSSFKKFREQEPGRGQ